MYYSFFLLGNYNIIIFSYKYWKHIGLIHSNFYYIICVYLLLTKCFYNDLFLDYGYLINYLFGKRGKLFDDYDGLFITTHEVFIINNMYFSLEGVLFFWLLRSLIIRCFLVLFDFSLYDNLCVCFIYMYNSSLLQLILSEIVNDYFFLNLLNICGNMENFLQYIEFFSIFFYLIFFFIFGNYFSVLVFTSQFLLYTVAIMVNRRTRGSYFAIRRWRHKELSKQRKTLASLDFGLKPRLSYFRMRRYFYWLFFRNVLFVTLINWYNVHLLLVIKNVVPILFFEKQIQNGLRVLPFHILFNDSLLLLENFDNLLFLLFYGTVYFRNHCCYSQFLFLWNIKRKLVYRIILYQSYLFVKLGLKLQLCSVFGFFYNFKRLRTDYFFKYFFLNKNRRFWGAVRLFWDSAGQPYIATYLPHLLDTFILVSSYYILLDYCRSIYYKSVFFYYLNNWVLFFFKFYLFFLNFLKNGFLFLDIWFLQIFKKYYKLLITYYVFVNWELCLLLLLLLSYLIGYLFFSILFINDLKNCFYFILLCNTLFDTIFFFFLDDRLRDYYHGRFISKKSMFILDYWQCLFSLLWVNFTTMFEDIVGFSTIEFIFLNHRLMERKKKNKDILYKNIKNCVVYYSVVDFSRFSDNRVFEDRC